MDRYLTPLRSKRLALASFGLQLLWVYLAMAPRGVSEDGWFIKRFAYNFRHHLSFSWNADEGALYGMTSQTLQFVGAALYAVAPEHVVLGLKVLLWLSLFATLVVISRLESDESAVLLALCGLSCPLLYELLQYGLETPFAMLSIALALHAVLRFDGSARRGVGLVACLLGVYLTRPDGLLIPVVFWVGLAASDYATPRVGRPKPAQQLRVFVCFVLALATLLAVFKVTYGTALPLPFYVKTHGLNVQESAHVALFAREKSKNALQFAFWCLPFVFVALHHRVPEVLLLLVGAAVFSGYHYVSTIETMAHYSRFYVPALVPVLAAAVLAWPSFVRSRRAWSSAVFCVLFVASFALLLVVDADRRIDIFLPNAARLVGPVVAAIVLALLVSPRFASVAVSALLVVGIVVNYRLPSPLSFDDDETILLRQIRPRSVFRGIEQLRRLEPAVVFHTDMGAPGVLFPRARVVDINGLLNRELSLEGVRFEALCQRENPDAIYAPNRTYPAFRAEVLSSECLKNYTAVTDLEVGSPLHIRNDLLERYRQLGP